MFFTLTDVLLMAKRVRLSPKTVSEELRGWHWNEPPIYYSSTNFLNVSDLTNGFCETGRYVYLKHKGIKPEVPEGANDIHYVYAEGIQTIKRLIYEEGENMSGSRLRTLMTDEFYRIMRNVHDVEKAKVLWDHITNIYSAEIDKYRAKQFLTRESLASLVIPFYVEYPIDGSFIGLQNNIRADAFVPLIPLIAEMKTGRQRKAHELSLAGYALAIESQFEIPIDFGNLCYVLVDKSVSTNCKLIHISDSLRDEFLEVRDRGFEAMETDPGMPKKCDETCPYLRYCNKL